MNKVVLMGRLTRDPEVRYTQSNMAVCNATIAVNRPFAKDEDEKKADFIKLIIFGKRGEAFGKYVVKGQQILIDGRINTGSYQKDNGDTVYTTDVIVDSFEFVGSKKDKQSSDNNLNNNSIPQGFEVIDDDIPF